VVIDVAAQKVSPADAGGSRFGSFGGKAARCRRGGISRIRIPNHHSTISGRRKSAEKARIAGSDGEFRRRSGLLSCGKVAKRGPFLQG